MTTTPARTSTKSNCGHTSSGTTPISSNADVAKFDLVIDAEAADASADAAAGVVKASITPHQCPGVGMLCGNYDSAALILIQ